MKHALPAFALQFFQLPSHVGAPTLVAIIECAARRATPDLLRDRIEQRPRLAFCPLAVLNIDGYSIPLQEVSLLIPQRRGANQDPAIFSVSPPQAHFILAGFSSGHVHEPLFHDSWTI